MGDTYIDAIEPERLRAEIKRLEYEKLHLVVWSAYDEERLRAYREVEWSRKQIIAMRNRIEDDCKERNAELRLQGMPVPTERAQ